MLNRHAMEPTRDRCPERARLPRELKETVLDRVFRVGSIRKNPSADRVHHVAVFLDERAERIAVTLHDISMQQIPFALSQRALPGS